MDATTKYHWHGFAEMVMPLLLQTTCVAWWFWPLTSWGSPQTIVSIFGATRATESLVTWASIMTALRRQGARAQGVREGVAGGILKDPVVEVGIRLHKDFKGGYQREDFIGNDCSYIVHHCSFSFSIIGGWAQTQKPIVINRFLPWMPGCYRPAKILALVPSRRVRQRCMCHRGHGGSCFASTFWCESPQKLKQPVNPFGLT